MVKLDRNGYLPTKRSNQVAPRSPRSRHEDSPFNIEGENDLHHETTVQYVSKHGQEDKMVIQPEQYRQTDIKELLQDKNLRERIRKGDLQLIGFQKQILPEVRVGGKGQWQPDVKADVPKVIGTLIEPEDLEKLLTPDELGVFPLNPNIKLFTRRFETKKTAGEQVSLCGDMLRRKQSQITTICSTLVMLFIVFAIVSGAAGGG